MLLDVARGFVRDQAPIEAVRAQLETDTGYDAAIWQAMVDMGWAGIALPDTVGGAGMGVGSAVPFLRRWVVACWVRRCSAPRWRVS